MQSLLPLLERTLLSDFIPHLPALLDTRPKKAEQDRKNLSRAFSAFALSKICSIEPPICAQSVVDDFDDFGIDTIFMHGASDTLYIIQAKLKSSEEFKQDEALAFCQGVRKLLMQDFEGFNDNILRRKEEIESALDNCSVIQLVIAHIGSGISHHAKNAIEALVNDESHGEERLNHEYIDYNAHRVLADLREAKAYEKVNADIYLSKCTTIEAPKTTYFGLIDIVDLVELHEKHPVALYAKNIRTFLGTKSDVNASIQQTLAEAPEHFMFLNNGITALCEDIKPKGQNCRSGHKRKLKVHGISIVNGAQTISSAAKFIACNTGKDISKARVLFTLIKSDTNSDFGKSITKARNHQNPVTIADFVALDDEQERLRRDLAHIGFSYSYKAGFNSTIPGTRIFRVETAAQALAIFEPDPRYVVWIKKEPSRLLDTGKEQYKAIFHSRLGAFKLANSITFSRFMQERLSAEEMGATGQTKLIYKHSNLVTSWILAKRIAQVVDSVVLIDPVKIRAELSTHFDVLRQIMLDSTIRNLMIKGPLAFFRNQGDVIPLMEEIMIQFFNLADDPVLPHKRTQQDTRQPYPKDLFDYLISKAPQIGNLT